MLAFTDLLVVCRLKEIQRALYTQSWSKQRKFESGVSYLIFTSSNNEKPEAEKTQGSATEATAEGEKNMMGEENKEGKCSLLREVVLVFVVWSVRPVLMVNVSYY